MINRSNKSMVLTLTGIVGFFLAIAPVLDPYILFEIGTGFTLKINDVIMLVLGILCFTKYRGGKIKTNYLCVLLSGLLIITVMANINSSTNARNSIKNIVIWFIYAIILTYIWKSPCRDKFLFWVEIIAVIAAVVVVMQFIAGYLGLPMWDGRISFIELGKYDGWAGYIDKNTGDIRPNGIFQEASYVGIYLSVAYVQVLREAKLKKAILYAVAMLATTSMVSVITCVIMTIYIVMVRKNVQISKKTRRKIYFIIIITFISAVILVSTNDSVGESFSYILKRITNFNSDLHGARMSSTKYRILGHIDLFSKFTPTQKLLGVGIAQYASLFNVTSYSNVWVTTILNSGILGCSMLSFVLLNMYTKINRENKIYFWVLIMILSADYQWFSWYFFYLISACILEAKEKKIL